MFERLIFPVEKKAIFHAGKATTKSKIVRTDKNKVISVVSNDYLLIPNRMVIDSIMREFHDYIDNQHNDYMLKKVFTNERYSTFEIPLKYDKVPIVAGDHVGACLRVENSYDTTKALTVSINAIRLVCSNGMTMNQEIFASKIKHIGDISAEDVVKEMVESVKNKGQQGFISLTDTMKEMTEQFLTTELREEFVEILSHQPHYVVNAIIEEMAKNEPKTMWDLYNCVTYVTTHKTKPGRHNTFKIEDEINSSFIKLLN